MAHRKSHGWGNSLMTLIRNQASICGRNEDDEEEEEEEAIFTIFALAHGNIPHDVANQSSGSFSSLSG